MRGPKRPPLIQKRYVTHAGPNRPFRCLDVAFDWSLWAWWALWSCLTMLTCELTCSAACVAGSATARESPTTAPTQRAPRTSLKPILLLTTGNTIDIPDPSSRLSPPSPIFLLKHGKLKNLDFDLVAAHVSWSSDSVWEPDNRQCTFRLHNNLVKRPSMETMRLKMIMEVIGNRLGWFQDALCPNCCAGQFASHLLSVLVCVCVWPELLLERFMKWGGEKKRGRQRGGGRV